MPAQVVDFGAIVSCVHGGPAAPVASAARVWVAGQSMVTLATSYVIAACPSGDPSARCESGRWVAGAARVLSGGTPVALESCGSVTNPTGAPMLVLGVQQRVSAS